MSHAARMCGGTVIEENDMERIRIAADANLAPPGYYAVLKEDRGYTEATKNLNICTFCDWRKSCQNMQQEQKSNPRYRCMSYARPDGASVVFKLVPPSSNEKAK
jgi:hypothetical protein